MSAEPDKYAITVDGLVNAVGPGQILHKDLNLQVRRDEVMTLVGGSGSGKTQLLRVILGLKRPVAGSVRVFGVSWDDPSFKKVRDARRRMGMLFQNGALFSALTVFDNVAFPLRERGGVSEKKIRAIVHAKLSEVELAPHHGTLLPASLSGGMVKRVALARALALAPDLVILDEPTAGLDPDRSERFVQLIQRLRADHRFAVLMVTHDLDTLFALTDRVAVLGDRHIIACGTLDEVRELPHPFVQSFFGGDRGRRALAHGATAA
ncbi:MAG TPA: ATP-binding cassette domain-containing protein [Burkholderiales bacterium]|jgi:phospholipid/cholesterol/gamma-HCH transport system ATP-binding protein|nr:ATP-binding cassette domain-containing protein [Burkholderiales bacterium]